MDGMPVQRIRFNALSGLSCYDMVRKLNAAISKVSMPSRAYTSFLRLRTPLYTLTLMMCQCPLGLIPHFYSTSISPKGFVTRFMCQCPLGLIPHFYVSSTASSMSLILMCVNALSGLYLISTVPLQKPRFYAVSRTCFCRYLSEYSDNSCFSCMLTFWTYLMRCTYP